MQKELGEHATDSLGMPRMALKSSSLEVCTEDFESFLLEDLKELVLPRFGPEPKFEPELSWTGPKVQFKVQTFAWTEPGVRF